MLIIEPSFEIASADPALLEMFPNHCDRVEDVLATL